MSQRAPASAFYLLYYAAVGALLPYLNLYYQQTGMTTHEIGVLAALPTIAVLFAGPFWASIADALHLHKHLLPLLTVGTMLPAAGLMLVNGYWLMAGLVLIFASLLAPIVPLADNAVLAMLDTESDQYGRLRIWGAVGFGLAAWVSGALIESRGMWIAFAGYLILIALTSWIATRLPAPLSIGTASYAAGVRELARNARWLAFLLSIFMMGTCYSILNNYFILYLTNLGAGEGLYGLSVAAAGVSELPVFLLSPLLLRRLKPRGLLLVAMGAFVIRGIAYSLIQDPRWAVGVQLLHGLSFSAMWAASVTYVGRVAPAGMGASAQATLGAVMFGLASATGALLGAWLYDGIGPALTFRVGAAFAVLGLVLFALTEMRARQMAYPIA